MDEGATAGQDLVRTPQQDRSRRTLKRLVEAALELIAERGVEGASVHDITRHAGASVGSFYARFGGKEDLLKYLEVQVWKEAGEAWAKAVEGRNWESLPFEELLPGMVQVLVDVNRATVRYRRVLEGRSGPGVLSDAARAFDERLSGDIRRLLLRHADRIRHPDPARAVDLALCLVVGTLRARDVGQLPLGSLEDADEDTWTNELTRVCLTYLGGDPAVSKGRGQMDFFEIWG